MKTYPITPMGAVRLSRQDKFNPSKQALRYFVYGKTIRDMGITIPYTPFIVFTLPMPKSWSNKKRFEMEGQPHKQKPDCDNLLKGLQDSIYYKTDDAHIWCAWIEKRWGTEGSIMIAEMPEDALKFFQKMRDEQ